MPIPESLCCLALNQLDIHPVLTVIRVAANVADGQMNDQSRALLDALERSNRKAWKALEIALAGETLWSRLDRADVKSLRNQIRAFIDQMPLPELTGKAEFRKKCLGEIRQAMGKGLLLGSLVAGDLAEKTGRFASYSDPDALLRAEKAALTRLGKEVQEAGFRTLGWLLAQPANGSQSVVVVAARYFFRREVETNETLFRGLQFTAVESLGESQKEGFRGLDESMKSMSGRLEEALSEAAAEILAAVGAVRADVQAAHDSVRQTHDSVKAAHDSVRQTHETAKAAHDSVQALAAEMRAQMAVVLSKLDMANKPVQPEHSMSVRSDREREQVRELLKKMRTASEEAQRGLAGDAGKLQVAIGDFAGAAASFTAAAAVAASASEKAEAYHNAYQAKLEQKDYAGAVANLKKSVQLDPGRFAPFPLDKYEPVRILGAGGFGVTFECKHAMTGGTVAVKSLTAHNLDQDVGAVLREATALDKLKHRAIVGLRDCGYADAGKRRPYLVMEYFDGQTLQDYVEKRGAIPLADLLPLARILAEALAAAHGQNVLHRDVKPANVMVKRTGREWEVRLIDFGLAMRSSVLAESMSTARGHTVLGSAIAGTLDYAAPEQLGKLPGVKVGFPADVYGFAKTLCFALFKSTEPTFENYQSLPEGMAKLIGKCLNRDPKDRPQNFAQVIAGLSPVANSPLPPAVPPKKPIPLDDDDEKPKPPKKRRNRDDDDYEFDREREEPLVDKPGQLIETGTRITHAIFAIVFGSFGVHKFMQGNVAHGLLRLAIGMGPFAVVVMIFGTMGPSASPPVGLACVIAVCTPLVVFAGLIEGIKYLGMSNESYTREYLIRKKGWF